MNINTASTQYASRPKDERFESLDSLIQNAQQDKQLCREVSYPLGSLKVAEQTNDSTGIRSLCLQSPKGQAQFTHWSFGQLCRLLGAPANDRRALPTDISASALNWALNKFKDVPSELLVKAPNGNPFPVVRSINSEKYGRLWDADFYSPILRHIINQDSKWTTPPTWSGESAGAYRGDRDSFLILTNGGSIVNDPSAGQGNDGALYRGLLLRNSEVGAAAVTIERILFRYICGNHILWGAVIDQQYRRRHIGARVLQDVTREVLKTAREWTNRTASQDENIIRELISKEIAHTKEDVIKELRKLGATKEQAESAYLRTEQTENASPRSYWGLSQGITRLSQDSGFQDDRFELDQLAALVLSRGRKLVAA